MEVRRKGDVKSGVDKVGNRTRVKVTKNKVAPPFKEAEVEIMFGRGIDKLGDLINIASDLDVVQKSGSFYKYEGSTIGQGKEKASTYLEEHPALIEEIKGKVMAAIQGVPYEPKMGGDDTEEADEE